MEVAHLFFAKWIVYVTVLNSPSTWGWGRGHILCLRVDLECAVFLFVRTVVWLSMLGIFNLCTDVDACNWTWGLHKNHNLCKTVCTESWCWEKKPLPHHGVIPMSAACWTGHSINWAVSLPWPSLTLHLLPWPSPSCPGLTLHLHVLPWPFTFTSCPDLSPSQWSHQDETKPQRGEISWIFRETDRALLSKAWNSIAPQANSPIPFPSQTVRSPV